MLQKMHKHTISLVMFQNNEYKFMLYLHFLLALSKVLLLLPVKLAIS